MGDGSWGKDHLIYCKKLMSGAPVAPGLTCSYCPTCVNGVTVPAQVDPGCPTSMFTCAFVSGCDSQGQFFTPAPAPTPSPQVQTPAPSGWNVPWNFSPSGNAPAPSPAPAPSSSSDFWGLAWYWWLVIAILVLLILGGGAYFYSKH